MRFVREFVFLLAILSLAVVPFVGVGCNDQAAKPQSTSEPTVDLGKADAKKPAPKPAKKKRADEAGSTTGSLGVKPPKAPADDKK